ncbi:AAA domain-containing protein [Nocardia caishijiensis]|uniref:Uncharacterized protein DUF2726 n=1 Tax=Nocardia caishijiensis TaxID=184756 RepID=A0ABQ6YL86_9NOCA|nr:AAA domain-containing protein [Nocardia caishijiensis]KAF0846486.1 uncharacterized protein DUF2726 [Nocardia caishijiensis]
MLDPRATAIVIRGTTNGLVEDKTPQITAFEPRHDRAVVWFGTSGPYRYGWDRVTVLHSPRPVRFGPHDRVFVDGSPTDAVEAYIFAGPPETGSWWHVLTRAGTWHAYRDDQVQVRTALSPASRDVLGYWRTVAGKHTDDAGVLLQRNYQSLEFIHPDSALARLLENTPIEPKPDERAPIPLYPFRTNISQSEAVNNALRYPISVIEGPPGTGKTQTILNIIASVICTPDATVGVVSFSNSAVENVVEKLTRERFGMVAANLGNYVKRQEFFAAQPQRNAEVDALIRAGRGQETDAAAQLVTVNRRLTDLQKQDRLRAEVRAQLHAYRLEQRHFQSYFDDREVPDADNLPLLTRYSARKLLDFIADTDPRWIRDSGVGRAIDVMNRYFRYRALRHVDADDIDVVLRIQRLYYEKKIAELERRVEQLDTALAARGFDELMAEQASLSRRLLRDSLFERYRAMNRTVYDSRYRKRFDRFTRDYPLIMSTCHSLQNSIGPSALLDYLIIDEASQVDLVTVAPALACARTVIVVGDLAQLPPVTKDFHGLPPAPDPVFDYRNSVLASIIERYGDRVPRRLLREHYRCDPDIIEFCNRKFYRGDLIPYTSSTPGINAMSLVRTVPGNHMRRTHSDDDPRSKARSNEREIDVIRHEVIPWLEGEFAPHEIGVTTPYRRQADKAADALIAAIEADTVHKFQGREKDAIIMTTVLDDTDSGRAGLKFADDPKLINVAVSRAMRQFVLVTHPSELPGSRHLRDLFGYVRYRDRRHGVIDSDLVSIFDLLYTELNERRRAHPMIGWGRTQWPSEDIALATLEEVLAQTGRDHLAVHCQVYLQNVFPRDLAPLDAELRKFVRDRSSFDFVFYNRITNEFVGAVEVDGFRTHEADPDQQRRDRKKDEICRRYDLRLLRLATTGSGEAARIRRFLDGLPGA